MRNYMLYEKERIRVELLFKGMCIGIIVGIYLCLVMMKLYVDGGKPIDSIINSYEFVMTEELAIWYNTTFGVIIAAWKASAI